MTGIVTGAPKELLRLENLALMIAAIAFYASLHASWWLFAIIFLVPDLSMIGYLKDPRLGAAIYNAGHWYVFPTVLSAIGLAMQSVMLPIGVIWIAHIALDRAFGFGLKYSDGFNVSHLATPTRGIPSEKMKPARSHNTAAMMTADAI